jgi:hypothetical protein
LIISGEFSSDCRLKKVEWTGEGGRRQVFKLSKELKKTRVKETRAKN